MGAVFNAISLGMAGSAVSGAMSAAMDSTLLSIIDFCDIEHIQSVVIDLGDLTVKDALEKGLEYMENASHERLQANISSELSAHPIYALAVTAQMVTAEVTSSTEGTIAPLENPGSALGQESPAGVGVGTVADRVRRLAGELGEEFDSNLNMKETIATLEMIVFGEERDGRIVDRVGSLEAELKPTRCVLL
jgi:hypothetical protein